MRIWTSCDYFWNLSTIGSFLSAYINKFNLLKLFSNYNICKIKVFWKNAVNGRIHEALKQNDNKLKILNMMYIELNINLSFTRSAWHYFAPDCGNIVLWFCICIWDTNLILINIEKSSQLYVSIFNKRLINYRRIYK